MSTPSKPPPPEGFENWLEYAIFSFDGHGAALNSMFDDEPIDHIQIKAIVLDEFNSLRERAELPPFDPSVSPPR